MSDDGKTRSATLGASIRSTLLCTGGMCLWVVGCDKQGTTNQFSHTRKPSSNERMQRLGVTGGTLAAAKHQSKAPVERTRLMRKDIATFSTFSFFIFRLLPNSSSCFLNYPHKCKRTHNSSLPLHGMHTHTGRGLPLFFSAWLAITLKIKINYSASPLLPAAAVALALALATVANIHSLSQSH